jgi:capsular exopolysaccharide synthesis family protein
MTVPAIASDTNVEAARQELTRLRQEETALAQNLGERHPRRIEARQAIERAEERRNREIARVVELIQNDYAAAQAEEAGLVTAVSTQQREALGAKARQAEQNVLERAATTDQQIFETLLQRAKEMSVTTQMTATNIRVIDAAHVPTSPVSPNVRFDFLISLVLGSVLAGALAFFAEYMDKTIKSPDQIKSQLNLNCLGIVPIVKHAPPALSLLQAVPPEFAEAFRVVRTNVILSSSGEEVRTILVTSTGPSEGKTVVASNLALLLAQTGQNVVLVDADLRRPNVHTLLDLPQEPGLSELAAGRLRPSEVVRPTSVPGLWVVPAGAIPPNPSEILSSNAFKKFITALGGSFDWVIIDSAPVMAVTDATLVAHVAAGVLFVVAAEHVRAPAALKAVEQLEVAQARFVGAVLNRVNLKRNAFYYADYHRREYGQYYQTPTAAAVAVPVSDTAAAERATPLARKKRESA